MEKIKGKTGSESYWAGRRRCLRLLHVFTRSSTDNGKKQHCNIKVEIFYLFLTEEIINFFHTYSGQHTLVRPPSHYFISTATTTLKCISIANKVFSPYLLVFVVFGMFSTIGQLSFALKYFLN